ncbi:hypothetical protein LTR94_036987, partial [Friedmanniomyces endolithicus]
RRGQPRRPGRPGRKRPRRRAPGPDRLGQHPHRGPPRRPPGRGRRPPGPVRHGRNPADGPGPRHDLGDRQHEGDADARHPRRPARRTVGRRARRPDPAR